MILLPQGIRGDFDRKSERGFEPCQALFQRTLIYRKNKNPLSGKRAGCGHARSLLGMA
jgi:hypothetical protein